MGIFSHGAKSGYNLKARKLAGCRVLSKLLQSLWDYRLRLIHHLLVKLRVKLLVVEICKNTALLERFSFSC